MTTTQTLTTETVIGAGYATKAGATRGIRSASRTAYAGKSLQVRVRPSAEWARIGVDKPEFVIVAI